MNLHNLQTEFQKIMLAAECTGATWVNDSAHDLSPCARMEIYHNAYRVRLLDVLLDTFEHTSIYLGDNWFRQLASNYVQRQHSTQTNIGLYGKAFPHFLAEELAADREVSELALLDWTLRRTFDGSDSSVMTPDALQQLASGESTGIRLQAVPTLSILSQQFNTLDIWHAINRNESPPAVEQLQAPLDVLIWRKDHSPHFRSLTKFESASLACICSANATLDDIGAVLERDFPDKDIATEFGMILQRWLDDEILSGD